jgi:hypothetical protein
VHFGLNDIRDLPRLEEFGDLIGETINDDLVAAINAAEITPASEETPLDPSEEVVAPDESGTGFEAANEPEPAQPVASEETQLESTEGDEPERPEH